MRVEDAVFLLKRNWFWDIQELFDFLWKLPEDVYCEIWDRKLEFHPEIQYWLTEKKASSKIVDYTDAEWNADQREIVELRDRQVREFRKRFVPPPRPLTDLDERRTELITEVATKKKSLEEAISTATKKRGYIPPSKRTAEMYDTDQLVIHARKQLSYPENELERVVKIIESLDKTWTEEKCLDALILNAGRLSEA